MGDLDLARRAMKATGWVWSRPERVTALRGGRVVHRGVESGVLWVLMGDEWLPDVGDDATRGRLLGLLRVRWSDPTICPDVQADGDGLWWCISAGSQLCSGLTEAEAIVNALEVPRG